jgi:acetyl esterase/lipase
MAGNWFSFFEWAESKDMIEVSKTLYTQRGYTVFEVVVASQPRYAIPDEINDLKRAIRYIRYNAKQLGIDPDHIGIEGGSAGGHLSLAVATADDKIDMASADPVDHVSSRVQAVAVLYPPTDFLNWGPLGNIINARGLQLQAGVYGAFDFRKFNDSTKTYDFISDTAARNKIGREISPLYFVSPDDPPVFIIHGDADPVVPLQQSQTIIAKFKEAGVPNNFIIKKGAKHNFDDMQPEVKQFADWFDKYLK